MTAEKLIPPPINSITLAQSLDAKRRHRLVEIDNTGASYHESPLKRPQLVFQYLDDGSYVRVPNSASLESPTIAPAVLMNACRVAQHVAKMLEQAPPADWSPAATQNSRDRLLRRADLMRRASQVVSGERKACDETLRAITEVLPAQLVPAEILDSARRSRLAYC